MSKLITFLCLIALMVSLISCSAKKDLDDMHNKTIEMADTTKGMAKTTEKMSGTTEEIAHITKLMIVQT